MTTLKQQHEDIPMALPVLAYILKHN